MSYKPGVHIHPTLTDKLLIRFYGQVIVSVNSRAAADAVAKYLRDNCDTGSRPGPARLDSIKAHAADIARAAAPNPSRGVPRRKAVRA